MNSSHESWANCSFCMTESSNRNVGTQGVMAAFRPLLSEKDFYLTTLSLSFLLIIFSSLGILSNALVLAAYLKIGFLESINISYFALGISDIGVLGTTLWGAILNVLEFLEVNLPFYALEISSPTMYFPGEGFEKTTSCITAYISLERCLCVLFPLHVKTFVTRKKTRIIIAIIFCISSKSWYPVS